MAVGVCLPPLVDLSDVQSNTHAQVAIVLLAEQEKVSMQVVVGKLQFYIVTVTSGP